MAKPTSQAPISRNFKAPKRRSLEGQSAPVIVSALIEDAITMLYGFDTLCKKVK